MPKWRHGSRMHERPRMPRVRHRHSRMPRVWPQMRRMHAAGMPVRERHRHSGPRHPPGMHRRRMHCSGMQWPIAMWARRRIAMWARRRKASTGRRSPMRPARRRRAMGPARRRRPMRPAWWRTCNWTLRHRAGQRRRSSRRNRASRVAYGKAHWVASRTSRRASLSWRRHRRACAIWPLTLLRAPAPTPPAMV